MKNLAGGGYHNLLAQLIYLRIFRKYGCCVDRAAIIGPGFSVSHPVGIVIGKCTIGSNFRLYQNCTIGVKHTGDDVKGLTPTIGNNVKVYNGSMILGDVFVCDNVIIGANSLCINSIFIPGIYVGNPVKKVETDNND